MNKDRFSSIADGYVLRLAVKGNFHCHISIRRFIDIDVADTVRMTKNRDAAVIHNILNKLPASAGNNQIDQAVFLQHGSDIFPCFKELCSIGWKAGFFKRFTDTSAQDLIRTDRFTSSFEQNSISALDAQGCNLDQSVRTAFKNDPNHADRANYPVECQSFRQLH